MKMSIAIIAACAGALVLAPATLAQAQQRTAIPIPGIPPKDKGPSPFAIKGGGSAKTDSGKPKQNRAAIVTSRSNIKHQGSTAPGKPNQAGEAINTSRSNIKY
jgi:hypothetical protein